MASYSKIRESIGSRTFDLVNNFLILLFSLTIILPFWYLLAQSFDSTSNVNSLFYLWPQNFTLSNYKTIATNRYIWNGYLNTIFITITGTIGALFFTSMGAYALSKKRFPNRVFWSFFVIITMFFSGGLIPTYLWIVELGLINNIAVLIIPGFIGAYNMILIRNFFQQIPTELEDSACIDGAGVFRTFTNIIIPVSKPILATVALWVAVGNWNSWFNCLIYMRDANKFVLQVVLQRIIMQGSIQMLEQQTEMMDFAANPEIVKAACIYITTLPILCVYPFLQKYFVKGIYVGSLKG